MTFQTPTGFCVVRRNLGHWDITNSVHGRLFRIRGGPGHWRVLDERPGVVHPCEARLFREQSAAMSFICAELMHELLVAEGQEPQVMEGWNIP